MKPLNGRTPFLESGKRFELPSGETFDQLRQPTQHLTSSTASTSPVSPTSSLSTSPDAKSGAESNDGGNG